MSNANEVDEELLVLSAIYYIISVAVQGMSRNVNSGNRETHGDRSSDDPYPEVGYFPHHSGQLNSPETETNSHMVTENYPHRYPIENLLCNRVSLGLVKLDQVHCKSGADKFTCDGLK